MSIELFKPIHMFSETLNYRQCSILAMGTVNGERLQTQTASGPVYVCISTGILYTNKTEEIRYINDFNGRK